SITRVSHKKNPNEGASWEHHATLVVTEVIKGKLAEKEIPLIIHYGLDPMVGGSFIAGGSVSISGLPPVEKDQIDLFDTGNSAMSFAPFMAHIEKDNLWFLRRRSGIYGREPGTGDFGIVDPEDVQPLDLKEYFTKYLEKDNEAAVRAYVTTHPLLVRRTQ